MIEKLVYATSGIGRWKKNHTLLVEYGLLGDLPLPTRADIQVCPEGEGTALYRRSDIGIDFYRFSDHPLVTFCPDNGFCVFLSTTDRDEIKRFIRIAVLTTCGINHDR